MYFNFRAFIFIINSLWNLWNFRAFIFLLGSLKWNLWNLSKHWLHSAVFVVPVFVFPGCQQPKREKKNTQNGPKQKQKTESRLAQFGPKYLAQIPYTAPLPQIPYRYRNRKIPILIGTVCGMVFKYRKLAVWYSKTPKTPPYRTVYTPRQSLGPVIDFTYEKTNRPNKINPKRVVVFF